MNRRTFLCGLTLGALTRALAATAQQTKVDRIGVLSTANPRSAPIYQAF
jgi:hypothetical protein